MLVAVAALLAALAALAALRVMVGGAFAWHACRVVFSRHPPASISALCAMLRVTRPLSIVWRVATAPFRCLPDVYVLGEVRCGTTTLASLLRDEMRMHGPFTPWVHPLAERKESFYFVGHYWRCVAPQLYRLCFPLVLARWARRALRRAPVPVFDACASYLSAPWVPRLVRAVTPRPVLVVCVREPVEQHLSWWRLEQRSMAWGEEELGLGTAWLGPPARADYPPSTMADAVALSRSARVREMYDRAAELAPRAVLPEWAAPFPNGQLASFDRMGRYADTLARWFALFPRECFVIVELGELMHAPSRVLDAIAATCDEMGVELPPRAAPGAAPPRLNAAPPLCTDLEPSPTYLAELAEYYRPHNERLFDLIGRDLGWHADAERYPYYHARAEGEAVGGAQAAARRRRSRTPTRARR